MGENTQKNPPVTAATLAQNLKEMQPESLQNFIHSCLGLLKAKTGKDYEIKTSQQQQKEAQNEEEPARKIQRTETGNKSDFHEMIKIPTSNSYSALQDIEMREVEGNDSQNVTEETENGNTQPQKTSNDNQPTPPNNRQHPKPATYSQKDTRYQKTASYQNKPPQQPRVAPIYLKDKGKWMEVANQLRNNNVFPSKSRSVSTGIQIEPETEEDYRKIKKILDNNKYEYYTFQLQSEKSLKVVIRGVDQALKLTEIEEDLQKQGYPTRKITRMNGKGSIPAPMVLVQLDREYKSIYDISNCCGLAVTVQPLRLREDIIQCHKCQAFGHSQRNCKIQYSCMKCGENHSTHLCTKPRTTPPKCANCQGEHLSISLRCPKNPNNPEIAATTFKPAPIPQINPWTKRKEEMEECERKRKEAEATTTKAQHRKEDTSNSNKKQELALILGNMMLEFNKTKATNEQKINFLEQTQKITDLFNI